MSHTDGLMAYWNRDEGYTRGGLDVVTAVNLFFKAILLFPIFLLAGYVGLIMMKHMIFQGIPSITTPTPEQVEQIHERNQSTPPMENTIEIGKASAQPAHTYDEPQKQVEAPQYYPETLPYYSEPHEEPYGRRTLDEALDDYTQEYYYD